MAAQALPTMLGIVILNFLLLQLVPGDAADVLAAESGSATAELMAQWRARFGLDQGLLAQLAHYLLGLARLDLGESLRYQTPVAGLIASRLPGTLQLMLSAWAIALAAGMAAGVAMASCAGRWPDRLLSAGVLVLYSMPGFWVGLMAVVGFAVHLGWFPSGGSFS
ncbi:ABC transporter permease, partial [Burkholderia sola]|uniref:ABC transporter permease n=1 Tax=Burkholderia sola TaxID=2843302 RepID=UPI00338EDEF6